MWELKYGREAKHLKKATAKDTTSNATRATGWLICTITTLFKNAVMVKVRGVRWLPPVIKSTLLGWPARDSNKKLTVLNSFREHTPYSRIHRVTVS